MKDEMFEELLSSVKEIGAIQRGELEPSRVTVVPEPDVKEIRHAYRLSQAKFAALLGISRATLQNWEQGRRRPEGPARRLLQVASRHPEAFKDLQG